MHDAKNGYPLTCEDAVVSTVIIVSDYSRNLNQKIWRDLAALSLITQLKTGCTLGYIIAGVVLKKKLNIAWIKGHQKAPYGP